MGHQGTEIPASRFQRLGQSGKAPLARNPETRSPTAENGHARAPRRFHLKQAILQTKHHHFRRSRRFPVPSTIVISRHRSFPAVCRSTCLMTRPTPSHTMIRLRHRPRLLETAGSRVLLQAMGRTRIMRRWRMCNPPRTLQLNHEQPTLDSGRSQHPNSNSASLAKHSHLTRRFHSRPSAHPAMRIRRNQELQAPYHHRTGALAQAIRCTPIPTS